MCAGSRPNETASKDFTSIQTKDLRSGVDTYIVEEPVCLRKVVWIVLYVVRAARRAPAGLGKSGTGPVPTEGRVKHNLVVFEVVRGAGRVGQFEAGVRLAPGVGLRRLVVNILGNLVAGEKERADKLSRHPFHGVDAAFASVEAGPHGRTGAINATSLVGVLVGSVDGTIGRRRGTIGRDRPIAGERRRVFIGLAAAIVGVQRGKTDVLVVYVFNDINLAGVGPLRADHPKRWPKATAAW